MAKLWNLVICEESGQGMVEYGLIIALVAIALIIALGALSGGLGNIFNKIGGKLNNEAAKAT